MFKNRSIISVVALVVSVCATTAFASFFDIFLESATSPPYPGAPVAATTLNQVTPGGPLVDTGQVRLTLLSESTSGTNTLTLFNTGPGGTPGPSGRIEYQPDSVRISSFFDIFLEILGNGGSHPPFRVAPTYLVPDSFFDVFLESLRPDLGGYQTLVLHCAPAEGYAIDPTTNISDVNMANGTLKLNFGLLQTGTPNPSEPAMTITMTGQMVPEPSTLAMLLTACGGLAFVAVRWRTAAR